MDLDMFDVRPFVDHNFFYSSICYLILLELLKTPLMFEKQNFPVDLLDMEMAYSLRYLLRNRPFALTTFSK